MIKDNKGFSLVEIAIVLVIFGVILTAATSVLTLFVNKGEAERTRSMIESNKNALFSFISSNTSLPVSTWDDTSPFGDFWHNVTYPNDGYNVRFFYYADPILDKTMSGWGLGTAGFADVNTICGATYTNTVVRVCSTAACSNASDYTDVANVAFVIASGSENKNIQTASVLNSTTNRITVYTQGADAIDDNFASDADRRREKYDDIVDWVTLDELKTRAGCEPEAFRFLNMTMPALADGVPYQFDFFVEGGVPFANASTGAPEYEWVVQADDALAAAFTVTAFKTRYADGSEQESFTDVDSTSSDDRRGAFLRLSGNTSALTGQYSITIIVYDNAVFQKYGATDSQAHAFEKRFLINAQ